MAMKNEPAAADASRFEHAPGVAKKATAMERVEASLSRLSRRTAILVGLVLIVAIGATDYVTGWEVALSIFYLLPILLIAWFTSLRGGLAASTFGAIVWFAVDAATNPHYSSIGFPAWNALVRFATFTAAAALVVRLRDALAVEKRISSTDYLTGLANSRAFYDALERESARSRRHAHPMTLCSLDIDNFKTVNDTLGHLAGDAALAVFAETLAVGLRRECTAARIGGDEFAILLPETDAAEAERIIQRVVHLLTIAVGHHGWPVTFSVGVVTYDVAPASVHLMLYEADSLMYWAKANGKANVRYSTVSMKEREGSVERE